MKTRSLWLASLLALIVLPAALVTAGGPEIKFKKTQLDNKFRSEGAAVGDFNNDGKMDISNGSVYYAAPDWHMVPILAKPDKPSELDAPKEFDPHGYSDSFCNFADDINRDGRTDLIVVDFPGKQTWWFEQPEKEGQPFKRHEGTPVTNNESPAYLNIVGDAKSRQLLLAWNPGGFVGYATPAAEKLWELKPASKPGAPGSGMFSHGIGAGDINGDGRKDILVKEGWWEQPEDKNQSEWAFHPAPFGQDCSNMQVYDFDGDGDNDVLTSAAHQVGMWWHEQTKDGWQTHEIDKSFSQTHSLCLADINGDKLPDFVTGKRYWAHGPGGDVDPAAPAVVCWFELARQDGKPVWTKHQIDDDSGVGTQFEVADVNGDGLLDVVTGNKKGANYFEQQR
jgi:hypothetical protein